MAVADDEWSFYVLRCGDGSLYAGIAKDVAARLAVHRSGKGARYTRGRGPLRLRAAVRCGDKGHALAVEARFKRLSRTNKVHLVAKKARLGTFVAEVVALRSGPR